MEERGFIEIKVNNRDKSLFPKDVDIAEIKEMISDIESFLYPTRNEKKERPQISYNLEEGSAKHMFHLPLTAVIFFNGLMFEIKQRDSLDFLDYKRQSIINKFQKKAFKEGYTFEFNNSLSNSNNLVIDSRTNFELVSPPYYESEFYLYGEIYQEGGKSPNLHISTKKYRNLTVAATKEQIMEGEKRTYKFYGLKVKGKKQFDGDKLFDLELIEYIQYNPVFNRSLLDKVIEKASKNLSKITNVDAWVNDLKTDGV